jgi:hypothetical protein
MSKLSIDIFAEKKGVLLGNVPINEKIQYLEKLHIFGAIGCELRINKIWFADINSNDFTIDFVSLLTELTTETNTFEPDRWSKMTIKDRKRRLACLNIFFDPNEDKPETLGLPTSKLKSIEIYRILESITYKEEYKL